MVRGRLRRENGAVPSAFDSLPRGPSGPQRRPTSWAAGLAPFGRTELAVVPAISGGQRLRLRIGPARRRGRPGTAAPLFPMVTFSRRTAQGVPQSVVAP